MLSLDVRSSSLALVSASLGLSGLALLGIALALPRPGWMGAALGLLALVYFGHLLVAGELSPGGAGLVGVALLLTGELGGWSVDARLAARYEPGVHNGRAVGIAWLGLLGFAVVLLGWLAAGLAIPGGIVTAAVAMAAAVALLGLISFVATGRRSVHGASGAAAASAPAGRRSSR